MQQAIECLKREITKAKSQCEAARRDLREAIRQQGAAKEYIAKLDDFIEQSEAAVRKLEEGGT